MSDDRQQTSDEWDAMVKRKAREYQAPDSTPPATTDHAQQLYLSASKVVTDWFNDDDPQGQPPFTVHHIDLVKRIQSALTQAHAAGRRAAIDELTMAKVKAKEAGQ